jgi:hypothetical protein
MNSTTLQDIPQCRSCDQPAWVVNTMRWLASVLLSFGIIPLATLTANELPGEADSRPVITRINARQLATVLQKDGFAAKFDEESEEKNVVVVRIDGYRAVCFVWDEGARIEFYGGFNDETLSPAAINDWASGDRLSRIFISSRGTAGIKLDLHLHGSSGISVAG